MKLFTRKESFYHLSIARKNDESQFDSLAKGLSEENDKDVQAVILFIMMKIVLSDAYVEFINGIDDNCSFDKLNDDIDNVKDVTIDDVREVMVKAINVAINKFEAITQREDEEETNEGGE